MLQTINCTIEDIIDVKTIVSEAVSNAIIHGYEQDKNKEVEVIATLNNNELTIKVIDEGVGIENVAEALRVNYSSKNRSGLGLTIIKSLSDDLFIKSHKDVGTKLVIDYFSIDPCFGGMEDFKEFIIKAQNNDERAKEELVNDNIFLVWSLVHRFNNSTYEKEELFQIGCVGLIKAINKFDVSYDVTFSTYAVPIILGEIKRHFRDDGAIKVSRSIKELNQKIIKLSDEYLTINNKEISIDELAFKLNVSKADIVLAIDSKYYPTSLNEVIYEKDGSTITIEERIVEKENYSLIDKITLKEEIAKLTPKEQLLIKMRYYMDMNQQDIAKHFNVSQVKISRMEKKILEKLKKQFI